MFQRGARCNLKYCTQTLIFMCMLYHTKLFPKFFKETPGAHGRPTTTLKDFGRSDCFLQLRIWSAGPHSFLVNIQIFSKGTHALHWNVALKHSCACCTKTVPAIVKGDAWGTWSSHCNPQRLWPFWLLLAAAHKVGWSPFIPCNYKCSECFNGSHAALKLKYCTQICPLQTFDGNAGGAWSSHCNSQWLWLFWLLLAALHIYS